MRTHSAFRAKRLRKGVGFGATSLLIRRMRRAFILVTVFSVALSPYFPTVQEASADTRGDGTLESTIRIDENTTNGPTLGGGNEYGRGVAGIGDLNDDGVEDLAAGAAFDGKGVVHISFMNTNGSIDSTVEINDSTANGPALSTGDDEYGYSIDGLGDLDGDGVEDIVVGNPENNAGGTDSGAVHIHFMDTDGSVKSTTEINSGTTNGPSGVSSNDNFGYSVANIGDIDDDGVNDIAVGTPLNDAGAGGNSGGVWIILLNSNGTPKSSSVIEHNTTNFVSLSAGDNYGTGVTGLGDLDGDGVPDIAGGAENDDDDGTNSGAAYITFMNTNGTPKSTVKIGANTANTTIASGDRFGSSAEGLGDYDGDGVVDLAVGARFAAQGQVHILFLDTDGSVKSEALINKNTTNGPSSLGAGDQYGTSVAAFDLDGDGLKDIAGGAPKFDPTFTDSGAVFIHFMSTVSHTHESTDDSTTENSITISRHKAGETVTLDLGFTLSNTITGTFTATFPSAFTINGAFTSGTCDSGTIDTFGFDDTAKTLTAEKTDCSGTVSLSGASVTLPSSAGQYEVTWTNDDPGSTIITVTDDDQVTVSAEVASEMTFDLDVGTTTDSDNGAPYTVALGTLTDSDVTSSGTTDSVNMIGVDLSTNASNGAVVQLKNANGTDGLKSTSVATDTIPAVSSTTLTAGTEGYGVCVYQVETSTGTLESAGFHSGGTLSATGNTTTSSTCDDATHQLDTGLTTTFQDILDTATAPADTARGEIFVKAAIASTTPAHDDYTDTLTFRATSTF